MPRRKVTIWLIAAELYMSTDAHCHKRELIIPGSDTGNNHNDRDPGLETYELPRPVPC